MSYSPSASAEPTHQALKPLVTVDNILYGKITTRAKAPSVAGVCSGWFFYKDDSQETDIELLSS